MPLVGGKNASLGELYRELSAAGVRVPDGFAITADAYPAIVDARAVVRDASRGCCTASTAATSPALASGGRGDPCARRDGRLARRARARGRARLRRARERRGRRRRGRRALQRDGGGSAGGELRRPAGDVPRRARRRRASCGRAGGASRRSSPTGRSPTASTTASITSPSGSPSASSAWCARTSAASGVMFTLDPDSGFRDVVLINAAYGLGEARRAAARSIPTSSGSSSRRSRGGRARSSSASSGARTGSSCSGRRPTAAGRRRPPRTRRVMSLTDADAVELARAAVAIEAHYSRRRGEPTPMDIEWAKDGGDGRLFIVQARPETVHRAAPVRRRRRLHAVGDGRHADRHRQGVGEKIGAGPGPARARARRSAAVPARRGAGRRHDRPRLGAGHEARGRHRDRSRRAHVPRGDRQPRARRARASSAPSAPPASIADGDMVTVSCAQGETGAVYRGALPFDAAERRPVGAAPARARPSC